MTDHVLKDLATTGAEAILGSALYEGQRVIVLVHDEDATIGGGFAASGYGPPADGGSNRVVGDLLLNAHLACRITDSTLRATINGKAVRFPNPRPPA